MCISVKKQKIRHPGIEPGPPAWKADVLTTTPVPFDRLIQVSCWIRDHCLTLYIYTILPKQITVKEIIARVSLGRSCLQCSLASHQLTTPPPSPGWQPLNQLPKDHYRVGTI